MYTEFMEKWADLLGDKTQRQLYVPEMNFFHPDAKRVTYLVPDNSGAIWYRGLQWIYQINRYHPTEFNVAITNFIASAKALHEGQHPGADVMIYARQDSAEVYHAIQAAGKYKVPRVYEIDDDIINMPAWNPSYTSVEKRERRDHVECIKKILKAVDYATVSTEPLKELYSKYISPDRIRVFPNAVDFDLFGFFKKTEYKKDEIVIGWAGSHGHLEDLRIIVPVIKRILKERANVKFFLAGWTQCPLFGDIPEDRIILRPWTSNLEEHYASLLTVDIAMCPLVDIPFNRSKSNVKYLEFSGMGVPTVCSDVYPYHNTVTHGETGFLLPPDEEAWYTTLTRLIDNADERKRIGEAGYQHVLKNYNQYYVAQDWLKFLREII